MKSIEFINKVTRRLDNPLMQSPTPKMILERGVDEFQLATIKANNSNNAWAVSETIITAQDGVRRYRIAAPDFAKALLITTVPKDINSEPEIPLEISAIEQLPREWAWLGEYPAYWAWGWFYGSTNARYAAVFKEVTSTGFENWLEIRPAPNDGDEFRILYQVGKWSDKIQPDLEFNLPFPEFDAYFVTLTALSLLPYTRWSADEAENERKQKALQNSLGFDFTRYEKSFTDYIASLTPSDIVYAEGFENYYL